MNAINDDNDDNNTDKMRKKKGSENMGGNERKR